MLKWINKKRNKKGFTLVELVVVIAILGVLAAIAVPRLSGFRKNAALAADKATAATIGKAAELYVAANGEEKRESLDKLEIPSEKYNGDSLKDFRELLDGDLKPQQEGEDKFYLEYVNGVFRVRYKDGEGDILYPENTTEEAKENDEV